MPVSVVRFNLVEPGATPASLAARYQAAIRMAAYADEHGITTVQTEEHHGAENNWLPSPFAFAGAVFGATSRVAVTVSAVIGPLHDPLRLAEDLATVDLLSDGRLNPGVSVGPPMHYALVRDALVEAEAPLRRKAPRRHALTEIFERTGEHASPAGVA